MQIKLIIFGVLLNCVSNSFSQTAIFEDDFESYTVGDDITTKGYVLTNSAVYTGNVTATVTNDNGTKIASLNADVNGQAVMQLRRNISVIPETTYTFEIFTKGNFKRKFQILSSTNVILNATADFTPTEAEKTQWIKHQLNFTVATGVSSVKINVFHNWSGTLEIDNIKVFEKTTSNSYYISSSEGNDSNDGTIDAPWETLSKISSTSLTLGDAIHFKKGDRFDGHFVVNGSGSETNPILITSYGSGAKPIITGEVGTTGGGDYQEAIYVENNDNIIFDGLEVNNERTITRTGVDDKDSYGIYILNSGNQIMRNFIFRNMTFQNVYAVQPMLLPEDFNGLEVAAVRIQSEKNTVAGLEKNIQDVLVEDCYFTNLQRLGVHLKHAGGNVGIGNDAINRNMNLIFRRNEFFHTGGTCILPTNTYNCLIEDNIFNYPGSDLDPRMPNRGSSVWTWRCHNTVIQNNQCLQVRGYLDSHGIHIDHENVNTFVQYNYMEDCEGGFVEILGGNVNAVYRFNVSVNDGWRQNENWNNSNHTLWINQNASGDQIHYCEESYIYNNTIVSNTAYSTAIDMNAKNTYVFNNIFYATNGANIGGKQVVVNNQGTDLFMKNNLFHGTIANSFKNLGTDSASGDPLFNNENSGDKFGYQLNIGSPGINAGVAQQGPAIPGAGAGIFTDIPAYPTEDFYGNPIDLSTGTPNIGACNAKNGEILAISDNEIDEKSIRIYPNPTNYFINILNLKEESMIEVFNTQGQILIQRRAKTNIDISMLENGIYFIKTENNKAIPFIKQN